MVTINTELFTKIKKIGTYCFIAFIVLLCISVFIPNSPVTGILLKLFYAAQNMNVFVAALVIYLINVICVCFMIPSTPVTIFSGLRLGVFFGTIVSELGCFTGCCLVYWITRFFLYDTVEGIIRNNKFMKSIQKIVEKHGVFFIALLRASPVFPFPVINYALSPVVSFQSYAVGSFIGLIPANFIVCYISVSITDIADAFVKNTLEASNTIMVIIIILITIGSIVAITVYIKIQLKKIEEEELDQQNQLIDEEHNENVEMNDHDDQLTTNNDDIIDIDTSNIIEIEDIHHETPSNPNKTVTDEIHEEPIQTFDNKQNETESMNEKKRISSPPVNQTISFNQPSTISSIIIDEDDDQSYNHNYNTYNSYNNYSSNIIVGDEEDIIQVNDNDDMIIIDPNA